ncbi:MAG: recombinase family protein [Clostridium sp.]|nr:recombinase family protein [Clostridium sp.]MDU7085728.1 recombinase family protein [Clostridium sp.]
MQESKSKELATSNIQSPPKKIAIYLRVSTLKQDSNTSKDNQLKSIFSYIKSNGWDSVPYEIYQDTQSASITGNMNNSSADSINNLSNIDLSVFLRKSLRQLIFDATCKKFDKVIVYSHDRLTRDNYEALLIRHTLNKLNIEIHYARPGETKNPDGNETFNDFIENLLSNLASLESKIIGGRVFLGNEYNIKHNYWAGGPVPYGYTLISSPAKKSKKKLSIKPHEAVVVKSIFELYNLGHTPENIASHLNSTYKHFKETPWSKDSVKSILNNPVYTGTLTWNKKGGIKNPRKKGSSEHVHSMPDDKIKIIDDSVWEKSIYIKTLQHNNPKFLSTPFLLHGLVKCGVCGNDFICKNHGNASGRVYFCSHKKTEKYLDPTIKIKAPLLHSLVFNELKSIINNVLNDNLKFTDFYSNYLNSYTQYKNHLFIEKQEIEKNISYITEMIKKSDDEITNLNKQAPIDLEDKESKVFQELIDSIVYFKTVNKLKKAELEKSLSQLNIQLDKRPQDYDDIKNYMLDELSSLDNLLNLEDIEIKNRCLRLLLHNLVHSVILDSENKIEIMFK